MDKVIAGIFLTVALSGCCGMYTNCSQPHNNNQPANCGCGCDCAKVAGKECKGCEKVTY